jgi:ABC-type glycerol-3-phosphate transport system permease component
MATTHTLARPRRWTLRLRWGSLRWSVFVYACALVLGFACGFPLLWMASMAFKPPPEVLAWPPHFLPQEPTLINFVRLFEESHFLIYLQNSLLCTFAATAISIAIATVGAYSLTRYRYAGRDKFATFILLAYMFPPIVLIVPFFVWMKTLGLVDSYLSLILSYVALALPFAIWLLRAFFQSIPLDIEEAAWMDGADRLRAIIYVILPLSLPGVIATSIFTFIVSWNDYLFALVLMTEEEMRTLPVGLGDLLNRAFIDWGVIMAAAMLITLPALVFFILTQNFLIRGWGAGAVKE